jgi:hypothetical protein
LPRVLRDYAELRGMSWLTLLQSLQCVRLVLWDENRGRLVSFRETRSQRVGNAPISVRVAGNDTGSLSAGSGRGAVKA